MAADTRERIKKDFVGGFGSMQVGVMDQWIHGVVMSHGCF